MNVKRDEFPCWIASDGNGPLAYNWNEVRLVEVADDGPVVICLLDGSEDSQLAVEPVRDAPQFFRKLAKLLPLRGVIGQTKPPC